MSFAPTATGWANATLDVESDDPDAGTVSVPLSGRGQNLSLSVTSSDLAFGTVTEHTRAERNLTIENTGNASVSVSNLSVSGSDAFGVQQGSFTVRPGATRNRTVYFEPTTATSASATLGVTATYDDDPVATVALSGTGRPASVEANRSNVTFGSQQVGTSTTATVSLATPDGGTVDLSGVELVGANASAFAVVSGDGETTLSGSDAHEVTVAFEPRSAGEKTERLRVLNDSGGSALEIDLAGTAVAPNVVVSPSSLSFANATVDQTTTRTLVVANAGDANLTVDSVALTDASGTYGVGGPSSFALAPGTNRTLSVTYTPHSTNATAALLTIRSDDPDRERATVWLSSTGANATTELNRTNETTRLNATVRNATAGEEVSIPIPQNETTGDDVQVDSVSVTPATGGDFSLNVTTSTKPLDSTPSFNLSDGTQGLGYLSIDHSIDNANITSASFTYRVNKSRLDALGSDPDDVALYRNVNGSWTAMPTTLVGETNGSYVFETTAPGLSEWTAAAKRPRIAVTDAFANVTAANVDDEVSIRVRITNTGGADGVYETRLLLDGVVVENKRVRVVPNATRQVFFERSFAQPGDYDVQVNEVFVAVVSITQANRSVAVSQETATEVTPRRPPGRPPARAGRSRRCWPSWRSCSPDCW
ncbi:choice-of-anchor D domain-containing protein [Haloarculaceae archaeon H-GB2-1]|nr:choice-of-anchor D domain-containing protein [Haloarculaceae archaeon H-GB11]MEA5408533.1 choice-of-anchor D domain-containing protein [Haloarculaceae archaeon H-GB2-1]